MAGVALCVAVVFSCCDFAVAQQARLAEQVNAAVKRGLEYLERSQQQNGTWESRFAKECPGGVEALAVLAALEAGRGIDDKFVRRTLRYIDRVNPMTVYARSVRAMVYARLGKEYADPLAADVKWLLDNQMDNGGWGYGPRHPTTMNRPDWTDSANTQIAILAIGDAVDAGAMVPKQFWSKCEKYWRESQNRDGGWGYETPADGKTDRLKGSSYGTMTAAGVASLLVIADKSGTRQSQLAADAVNDGLKWLTANYTLEKVPGWVWGTGEDWLNYMFNLVVVADKTGMRRFGSGHIWIDMAGMLLKRQDRRGAWGGRGADDEEAMQTCMAILCLSRANRPVMINRTAFADENSPTDAAAIVEWAVGKLKVPMTWQTVQPNDSAGIFNEAPILMINWDAHSQKLVMANVREFLQNGGTVLAVVDKRLARQQAVDYFVSLAGYSRQTLGDDHPIFNLEFKIRPGDRPDCLAAGDAIRTRVFVVDKSFIDGTAPADRRGPGGPRGDRADPAAAFVTNMLLYTTDMQAPQGRLAARQPAAAAAIEPTRRIVISRIVHNGGWDVCPAAFDRLSETLTAAVSMGVKEEPAVKLDGPVIRPPVLLWMTGVQPPKFEVEQLKCLKKYIVDGGTLFIDPAVGTEEFYNAAVADVEKMFGSGSVRTIDFKDKLITGEFGGGMGADITYVDYSRALDVRNISAGPHLSGVVLDGRLAVIISRYGVTCPMEGCPTFGCLGLSTADARRVAANVVLYAACGK